MDNSLLTPMERLANAFEAMAGIDNGSSGGGDAEVLYIISPRDSGKTDADRSLQVAVKVLEPSSGKKMWFTMDDAKILNVSDPSSYATEEQVAQFVTEIRSAGGYVISSWSEVLELIDSNFPENTVDE